MGNKKRVQRCIWSKETPKDSSMNLRLVEYSKTLLFTVLPKIPKCTEKLQQTEQLGEYTIYSLKECKRHVNQRVHVSFFDVSVEFELTVQTGIL